MCVYMCTPLRTHVQYAFMSVYAYMCIFECVNVCAFVCACARLNVFLCVHTFSWTCLRIMHEHMSLCMCGVCVRVCVHARAHACVRQLASVRACV